MGLKNRQFFKKAAVLSACRDGSFTGEARAVSRRPISSFNRRIKKAALKSLWNDRLRQLAEKIFLYQKYGYPP
jgi:hypothetical protein